MEVVCSPREKNRQNREKEREKTVKSVHVSSDDEKGKSDKETKKDTERQRTGSATIESSQTSDASPGLLAHLISDHFAQNSKEEKSISNTQSSNTNQISTETSVQNTSTSTTNPTSIATDTWATEPEKSTTSTESLPIGSQAAVTTTATTATDTTVTANTTTSTSTSTSTTSTTEIGRAVQQECRDRSRMPSSA
eukprot:TRINITY_DN11840_c0_g1_i4.p1 TRINITY_DN11840_c0_g1~~TRINITY_DN11840_c0_g1_i4.p1  ORF type:complete len:194 (-),score=27.70 TRINITY_DN11840_c0_g1_i4:11-592(-)